MTSLQIHNTLIPIGEEDAREMWIDGVLSMFDDAYSITTNRALNTAEVEQLCLAIWRAAVEQCASVADRYADKTGLDNLQGDARIAVRGIVRHAEFIARDIRALQPGRSGGQ